MRVFILAGGLGTRLSEETSQKPKPMVEIGGRPILWHIMKHYAFYGFNEFVIAMGYKADVIKRYFVDYVELNGNLTVKIHNGESSIVKREQDEWVIHLEDTGLHSNTGGRVKQLAKWANNEVFMLTYGDGVANVPLDKLLAFHKQHKKLATLTAVRPPARFGGLNIADNNQVTQFSEKPQTGEGWINGGYLILEPQVIDYISNNNSSLESEALESLARDNQLVAYRHDGFWQCMDTLRELNYLEKLWSTGNAPWKLWA